MTSIKDKKITDINEQLICFEFEIILRHLGLHTPQSLQPWQDLNFLL